MKILFTILIIFLSTFTCTYSLPISISYTEKELTTLTNYQPYEINTSFQGAGSNNLKIKKARKYRDF